MRDEREAKIERESLRLLRQLFGKSANESTLGYAFINSTIREAMDWQREADAKIADWYHEPLSDIIAAAIRRGGK